MTNVKAKAKAYAKINLCLDIVSKMEDGYHYLKTVMQTVDFADEVTIECTPGNAEVSVNTTLDYIPKGEGNIAATAALAFFNHTGINQYNVSIDIVKNIPICSGLGGGSADAACVLRVLNELFDTHLDRETLEKIGLTVGADVPFCITGGTKLAEGRGEILGDLPPLPQCSVVICKPLFHNSTPELFSKINCKNIRTRPDTDGLVKAIEDGDLSSVGKRMYNVFEDFLPRGKSDVDEIKSILLEHKALGAVMTGSGSAVFGLFDDKTRAQNACGKIDELGYFTVCTETSLPVVAEIRA